MKGKTIAFIVLGVGAALTVSAFGCCAGFLYLGYKSATDTVSPQVDELFQRIDDGTFAETYDTETTQAFRSVTTREQYADIGNVVKNRLGRLQSKSMQSYNMRQINARSTIEAKYAGTFEKGSGTIDMRFVREGDAWKIEHLRVDSPIFTQDLVTAVCPHCGAAHAVDARFCPACGKELPAETASDGP